MTTKPSPTPTPKIIPTSPSDGKIKVQTTGDFMLLDPSTGAEMEPRTPTRVPDTGFIQRRLKLGDLEIVK